MTSLLAGLVAILLQLGLAILGWRGFAAYFSHPPLAALTVATLVTSAAAIFSGGNLSTGGREDRANRWVVGAFGLLGLGLAYFSALTDRRNFWTIDGDAARWTGFTLFVLGSSIRLWSVFVLGRRFSGLVAIQQDHELVTTGIYRHIRHPSYLGLLASWLGWALAFRAGLGLLIAALVLLPLSARIRAEEHLLADEFGTQYESYRARTWRLLPGIY